jgi:hypothetical protein
MHRENELVNLLPLPPIEDRIANFARERAPAS